MSDFLYDLYFGQYSGIVMTEEYQKLSQKIAPYWDIILEHFGFPFTDDFSNALSDQKIEKTLEAYRSGIQLGFQLAQLIEE